MGEEPRKNRHNSRRTIRNLVGAIPSMRSLSRKNCPPGMIRRKQYTRRYSTAVRNKGFTVKRSNGKTYHVKPKASNMLVESSCIKNVGAPGKGPKLFGPLRKGELAKHGYSFRRSEAERHAALKKAVNDYGVTGVFRKLNAVAKLTKRASPKASNVFTKDREWIHAMMK
jgi:hypothetical protein